MFCLISDGPAQLLVHSEAEDVGMLCFVKVLYKKYINSFDPVREI